VELWELVARESIRDLVARYNANGDTGRFAEVLELFAPDAVMEIPAGTYDGIERIETIFTGTQQRVKGLDPAKTAGGGGPARVYMRHHTSTLQIDLLDQTHAKSRCYYQVLMHHGVDHWGRYIDEFEVRDGRWLFTRRKVSLDGYVPGGMGEAGAGTPDE
jgi:3-phenylpropionate/cinnamic acid dioxygenase small subunit